MNKNIPQDWQIKSLEQIGFFLKGKGIAKAEIVESGKPCIRYGEIYSEYNYFVEDFKSFIDEVSAKNSERIYKNDLLLAGSGETLEDIGKCVAYIKDDEAYAGGDIIILRPQSEEAHYLGYLFNNDEFKRQTFKLGQGHSVVHIYSSSLKNVKVLLPPLPEQQKIAKILATWDKAIVLQQKQIIKKKLYKKTTMKKMLTGEVRFKGFVKEWKEYKLKEICIKKGIVRGPFGGALKKEIFVESGFKVYEQKNAIYKSVQIGDYFVDEKKYKEMIRFSINENDLIISCSGTIGRIFRIPQKYPKGIINQALLKLTLDKELIDVAFFEQLFNSSRVQNRIIESTQGGAMRNLIGMDDFKNVKFSVPSLEEQQRIASFLSCIDNEINALDKELIALQKQKQGLMQQLLTGKVRVKIK